MASVDRADYMDNIKVAEVEQTIQKEKEYAFLGAQQPSAQAVRVSTRAPVLGIHGLAGARLVPGNRILRANLLCSIQRAFFQHQEKMGKLQLRAPTPPKPKQTLKEKYGVSDHLDPILKNPEEAMSLTFSKQLWANAVPGLSLSPMYLVLLGGSALLNLLL